MRGNNQMTDLRYCIVTEDQNIFDDPEIKDSVGFYQWLKVFDGKLLSASAILPDLHDGDYDIIHIQLNKKNFDLSNSIRKKIGINSRTKFVITMNPKIDFAEDGSFAKDRLKTVLSDADIIFATEHEIVDTTEKLTGLKVHEIPYPADTDTIKSFPKKKQRKIISILNSCERRQLNLLKIIAGCMGFEIRLLLFREELSSDIIKKSNIEIVNADSEEEFIGKLSESAAIIAHQSQEGNGKKTIYAALSNCLLLGYIGSESIRRCYPFTALDTDTIMPYLMYFLTLNRHNQQEFKKYIVYNADNKVNYYNHENLKKRFLDLIFDRTGDIKFRYFLSENSRPIIMSGSSKDIYYIQGETNLGYEDTEFSVVCLLKDGMPYLPAFLSHYRKLGACHFYFIDNGSKDETISFLKEHDDVTIYFTALEHKRFEAEIRQTIIEDNCRNRWCLCVDIDEFFEYPYSDIVTMKEFLHYLNLNKFTSMISYMLDMFPLKINIMDSDKYESFESSHCYFDISCIKEGPYYSHAKAFCNYNVLKDSSMNYYYGGIRKKIFSGTSSKYLLIKHPLMFIDKNIDAVINPHYCNKAYIADINGVLKHYKFLSSFTKKIGFDYSNYDYFALKEYDAYLKKIRGNKDLILYSRNSSKFSSVNDLVKKGFLKVSKSYVDYVNEIKKKS
jgi:hypothetical protein